MAQFRRTVSLISFALLTASPLVLATAGTEQIAADQDCPEGEYSEDDSPPTSDNSQKKDRQSCCVFRDGQYSRMTR